MKQIKILVLTNLSKEEIECKPSNFYYYIKNLMSNPSYNVILSSEFNKSGMLHDLKNIRKHNPDIIYLTRLSGHYRIILYKTFNLIHSKIILWKYTRCELGPNGLTSYFLSNFFWKKIDMLYMEYNNHTQDAIKRNIVAAQQIKTLHKGPEIKWYEKNKINDNKNKSFLVIAIGKDSRDYNTLCKACEIAEVNVLILTRKHPENIVVSQLYRNSPFCQIVFIEDLNIKNEYEWIHQQVSKGSLMAICCREKNYGVGNTNVIETLPYRIPIIMTKNVDIELNLDDEGIGFLIQPYDVQGWVEKLKLCKDNIILRQTMSQHIDKIILEEYNDKITSEIIFKDIERLVR